MKWSDTLSMPLWLCLLSAVLALLATIAAMQMLPRIVRLIAQPLSNAQRRKRVKSLCKTRKYPPDMKSPVLESRPFTATKPWR